MYSLQHQNAVITGASSGIGRAIAIDLAKAGVQKLHLLGRNEERLKTLVTELQVHNANCHYNLVNLEDVETIETFCNDFTSNNTTLDILIHSAGVVHLSSLEQSDIQNLDHQYAINLRAPFLITQKLLPLVKASKGDIVFINSGAGLEAGPTWSQYAATKHGLKALADSLRSEVKKDGIRVISIYPGRTATAMQEDVYAMENRNDYDSTTLVQPEDIAKQLVTSLSMSKAAVVSDVRVRT